MIAYASVEKPNQTPYLLVYTDKGKFPFPLDKKNYWTVGRGAENDLVLRENWISRNHAILQSTETDDFYIIDLGSRNGTFVNGRRVSIPVTLKHGDQIAFGKTAVEFYYPARAVVSTDPNLNVSPADNFVTSTLHERRLTSVMVVDMRNFTVLTRQLDEKVLSQLIGEWFREAGHIIRGAGSWVDKYIGDAVMAIWFHGAEKVNQRDILRIFQAVHQLNKITQALSAQYPLPFQLRIGAGINTGYAMVGNTGSGDHPDYTAIGDTVNAAFRLESATKQMGLDLAVGETTYSHLVEFPLVKEVFQQQSIILKGYETSIITYGTRFEDLERFLTTNPLPEISD